MSGAQSNSTNNFVSIVVIGSNDLAEKVTGLARKRIAYIINCNNEETPNMFQSEIKYVDVRTDDDLDSEHVIAVLKDFVERADARYRIMIHAKDMSRTRVMMCKIAIKIFGMSLAEIVDILSERQKRETESSDYKLTPSEVGELVKFEMKLFGASSYIDRVPDPTQEPVQGTVQDFTQVPATTSSAGSGEQNKSTDPIETSESGVSDELLMKLYAEDIKNSDTTPLKEESVRDPIPPQTMILQDGGSSMTGLLTHGGQPDSSNFGRSFGTSYISFNPVTTSKHSTSGRSAQGSTQRPSQSSLATRQGGYVLGGNVATGGSSGHSSGHSHRRTSSQTSDQIKEDLNSSFSNFMSAFSDSSSQPSTNQKSGSSNSGSGKSMTLRLRPPQGAQGTTMNPTFSQVFGKEIPPMSSVVPSPHVVKTPVASTTQPQAQIVRPEDFDQIMQILGGGANPDAVQDMLRTGMTVSDIINALM
ncbi:putative phosphatase [Yasminevirus sp. GU-2018]|uniref:Putative phosphatase n=1 Tax=Yasminevirus sp. GU-2018 TaxID=2420051 RepID=A0A5K0UAP6_9VIRU|nr:putative phosphatase [Yasminevirus sp. GU-2018]